MKRKAYDDALILGNILKRMRNKRGISQLDLALAAEINTSYLSSVENGYSYISVYKLLNICTALRVSPADIMEEFMNEYANFEGSKSSIDNNLIEDPLQERALILSEEDSQELALNKTSVMEASYHTRSSNKLLSFSHA